MAPSSLYGSEPVLGRYPRSHSDGDASGDACDSFSTDPTEDTDTDGDGIGNNADEDDVLGDFVEALLGTDQLNSDTDGDGVSDGDEVGAGTDPNDPKSPRVPSLSRFGFGILIALLLGAGRLRLHRRS